MPATIPFGATRNTSCETIPFVASHSECTDPFTHRPFYTQTLVQTNTITHTDAFTHRPFYTQSLLHTNPVTQKPFYAQFLPIDPPFARKGCTRQARNRTFTSVLNARTSFRAKGLPRTSKKSQFYLSFCRSTLISCERVARTSKKSHFYLSF